MKVFKQFALAVKDALRLQRHGELFLRRREQLLAEIFGNAFARRNALDQKTSLFRR